MRRIFQNSSLLPVIQSPVPSSTFSHSQRKTRVVNIPNMKILLILATMLLAVGTCVEAEECWKHQLCSTCVADLADKCGWSNQTHSCVHCGNGFECTLQCGGQPTAAPTDTPAPPQSTSAAGCGQLGTCTTCTQGTTGINGTACGWCTASSKCVAADDAKKDSTCPAAQLFTGTCPQCSSMKTCDNCTSAPGCGFCKNTQKCTIGNAAGPEASTDCDASHWSWSSLTCPMPCLFRSCSECSSDRCGWCASSNVCMDGIALGPDSGKCDTWSFGDSVSCQPAAPAGTHSPTTPLGYFVNLRAPLNAMFYRR